MSVYSRIISAGGALPGEPISNQVLSERLAKQGVETSDQWIVERTGIRQRYLAADSDTSSSLAAQAAKEALQSAGVAAESVDLIVVATSTPDAIFPSTACYVQQHLGNYGAAAFDVQAVCAGFVYGLATADALIRSGSAKRALVIGAEVFSRILDWNDRGTCVLFGDGAGALLLEASDKPGIHACRLHADARQEPILRTAGQVRNGQVTGHPFLTMDGQAVFKMAVTVLNDVGKETTAAAGMSLDQVDWLIPHQANVRILQATGKRLGLAPEKTIVTVDQHANTSAASVPLAFNQAWRDGRIKAGHNVLMEGVGGGFAWGAALATM
jgi:3-oxoacyl-[acyl-carrier-protein] synthase III